MISLTTWSKNVYKVTESSIEKAEPDSEKSGPRTKYYRASSDAALIVISESRKTIELYVGRDVSPKKVQKHVIGIAMQHPNKKMVIVKLETLKNLRSWDTLVTNYNKLLELDE